MEDFYDLLGVSADAPTDEIDRAWREQVRRYHPDVNDDTRATAQFKTLETAHEVLTDETKRAAYDRLGHDTYVRERLDGLPTPRDRTRSVDTADSGEATGAGTASTAGTGARHTAADAGDDPAGDASKNSSPGAGESSDREGRKRRTAGTGSRRQQTADTDVNGRATTTHTKPTGSTATASRKRPRGPLVYGWIGIALVGAVYLVGVRSYLVANAVAVSALVDAAPTSPSVLLTAREFVSPGAFAAGAVTTMAVERVALGVGMVGLAVGFGVVVARFGRGTAPLYAVGGATPLAALALGSLADAPDGVVVLLIVVVPAVTVVLFLLDVGWVLATR